MATLDLLNIKVFWNKGHDVINFVHEVIKKTLSCDLNYIVDVVTWPRFNNSSISMRKTITSSSEGFDQKR